MTIFCTIFPPILPLFIPTLISDLRYIKSVKHIPYFVFSNMVRRLAHLTHRVSMQVKYVLLMEQRIQLALAKNTERWVSLPRIQIGNFGDLRNVPTWNKNTHTIKESNKWNKWVSYFSHLQRESVIVRRLTCLFIKYIHIWTEITCHSKIPLQILNRYYYVMNWISSMLISTHFHLVLLFLVVGWSR